MLHKKVTAAVREDIPSVCAKPLRFFKNAFVYRAEEFVVNWIPLAMSTFRNVLDTV